MPRSAAAATSEPVRPPVDRDELTLVPVLEIADNPRNPRHAARAELQAELNASVCAHGVLEPLIVRPNGQGSPSAPAYELVAGQRRLIAARAAALQMVPAVVKDLTDEEAFELATVENVQRADMHPLDEAEAYAELKKRWGKEATVAARVGKTESHVYRRLKLLALEEELQDALREDRLSLGHAEKLLQLSAAQRKIAAHPENGVVWSYSPLLEYDERKTWIPQREDLRPLHDLEKFIRDKSTFDPLSDDTRHFQPALAEQLDDLTAPDDSDVSEAEGERQVDEARADVVLLSEDPLVKSRLNVQGRAKNDPVPLSPTYWRETKGKACAFARPGVVVHGGPSRAIVVCTKRICPIHWPEAKKKAKKATSTTGAAKPAKPTETYEERWKREAAERKVEAARWATVRPDAKRRLVNHLAALKLDVPFIKVLLDQVDTGMGLLTTDQVKKTFGVSLTSTSLATVLALAACGDESRDQFADCAKPWRFDMTPIDEQLAKLKKAEIALGTVKSGAKKTSAKAKPTTAKKAKAKK